MSDGLPGLPIHFNDSLGLGLNNFRSPVPSSGGQGEEGQSSIRSNLNSSNRKAMKFARPSDLFNSSPPSVNEPNSFDGSYKKDKSDTDNSPLKSKSIAVMDLRSSPSKSSIYGGRTPLASDSFDPTKEVEIEEEKSGLIKQLKQLKREVRGWEHKIEDLKRKKRSKSMEPIDQLMDKAIDQNNKKLIGYQFKVDRPGVLDEGDNELQEFSALPISDWPIRLSYLKVFSPNISFENLGSTSVNVTDKYLLRKQFFAFKYKWQNILPLFTCNIELNVTKTEIVESFKAVSSPWVRMELSTFISKCYVDKDVLRCLHGLVKYGELLEKRIDVFKTLAQKYQPLMNKLQIITEKEVRKQNSKFINARLLNIWRDEKSISFGGSSSTYNYELVITWNISFNSESHITGEPVSLISTSLIKKNENLKTPDLSQIGSVFQSLISREGVYNAASVLVDTIYYKELVH